ncbi:MAG: hypothetical protein KF862_07335 [Chitinophagaceae bacterium]|nr:hypothetical protein [Chitinophagaceae bacterium]
MTQSTTSTAFNLFDNLLSAVRPADNMEVANRINANLPADPSPYFNIDIHNYLMSRGARFEDCNRGNGKGFGKLKYTFEVGRETVKLVFRPDVDGELIFIQYWWVDDDPDRIQHGYWLTDHRFTNPGTLEDFKTILNAYLHQ